VAKYSEKKEANQCYGTGAAKAAFREKGEDCGLGATKKGPSTMPQPSFGKEENRKQKGRLGTMKKPAKKL